MAVHAKHLITIGDACGPLIESTGRINHAAIFVPAGAVGTFVLEVGDGRGGWIAHKLTDASNAAVDNLVGGVADQFAKCDIHGALAVRARKSAGADDNDATKIVTLSTTVGSMS